MRVTIVERADPDGQRWARALSLLLEASSRSEGDTDPR